MSNFQIKVDGVNLDYKIIEVIGAQQGYKVVLDNNELKFVCETGNSSTIHFDIDVKITNEPKISLVKSGVFQDENKNGYADEGETILYELTVSNEGKVILTNIIVSDFSC